MLAFKVVRQNLTSLGLRAAWRNPIQYETGKWIFPREPVSTNGEIGGLYVTPTFGSAKGLQHYFEKYRKKPARIFLCEIGRILKRSSCRIKTDKVKLIAELKVQKRRN